MDVDSTNSPSGATEPAVSDDSTVTTHVPLEVTKDDDSQWRKRILGEKKRAVEENRALKDQIEAHEKEKAEAEDKKLQDNEQWQQRSELQAKEIEGLKGDKADYELRQANGRKLHSVLNVGNCSIPEQYYIHFDLDKIITDPITGEPDPVSAKQEWDRFAQENPMLLIKPTKSVGLPLDAPNGSDSELTYDDWLKLPYKEMEQRRGEIMQNIKNKGVIK